MPEYSDAEKAAALDEVIDCFARSSEYLEVRVGTTDFPGSSLVIDGYIDVSPETARLCDDLWREARAASE